MNESRRAAHARVAPPSADQDLGTCIGVAPCEGAVSRGAKVHLQRTPTMTNMKKLFGITVAVAVASLSPSITYAKHSGTDERKPEIQKVEKPRLAKQNHNGTDDKKI